MVVLRLIAFTARIRFND